MDIKKEVCEEICLISDDELKHEFDMFNMSIDETQLAEAKRLCILYNIDATELVAQWVSFMARLNSSERFVTDALMERFEREYVHRKAVSIQTEILDGHKKKIKTETLPSDMSILRDYGNMSIQTEIFNERKRDVKTEKLPSNTTILNDYGSYSILPEDSSKIEKRIKEEYNSESSSIENECALKKFVIQYYGQSLSSNKWANEHGNAYKVSPFDSNLYLDKPYKYMKLNLHLCSEVVDQFSEHLIKPLMEKLNIDLIDDFSIESTVERHYVGKVRVEASDGKLLDSVFLEMSQNSRRRAKMDLSNLSEYSLFPGQVIAVKSTYDFNSGLKPSEIADSKLTINPFSTKSITLPTQLHIVSVSGPYHSSNDVSDTLLLKLFEYVKQAKPQFIILSGPFVDSENNVIKETQNPFDFFDNIMSTINHQLQNTETTAIVVPSPRDLHHDFIYPTPPFQRGSEKKWPNIYFAPNPCLLDISGIVIAVNGTDVLMHMIRNEIARITGEPEATNRMVRLCKHLLCQQSFYPLNPADPRINVHYSKLEHLHLPVTPHLFLLSSQLKSFAKRGAGCIFVSTESLSKGIMSRIRIDSLVDIQGSLDKHIDVEIVKL